MSPDLNSLPPSNEESRLAGRPRTQGGDASREPSPSHAHTSPSGTSAGQNVQPVRRSPRPRGAMRINLNDPALPLGIGDAEPRRSPHLYRTASGARREGLTGSGLPSPRSPISGAITQGDPHHQRAPSLGELHQELEQEQEAQVMIRRQQAQLDQLQSQSTSGASHGEAGASGAAVTDDASAVHIPRATSHASSPRSVRSHSRRSSQTSPIHAFTPPDAGTGSGGRDEAAFYATETQSLARENQMLRVRIRELERRVRDMDTRERADSVVDSLAGSSAAAPAALHGIEQKDDDAAAADRSSSSVAESSV